MFNSLMMLALQSNRVIALRCMTLMLGGKRTRREAELMLAKDGGCYPCERAIVDRGLRREIVRRYGRHVAANATVATRVFESP